MKSQIIGFKILLLLAPSSLFAQSGTFTESRVFIGPKACNDTNYVRNLRVELDDYIDDSSFILRMVPSGNGVEVCPLRPVTGTTIIHGSKRPESCRVNELDLNLEVSGDRLTSFLSCAQNGVKEDGLFCLYAKKSGGNEIYLVAQTNYRIDTRVKSARAASTQKEHTLIKACEEGDISFVKELLREGVDPEIEDENRWRPLHIAAWKGNIGVARTLIYYGADIEAEISNPNRANQDNQYAFRRELGSVGLHFLATPLQIAAYRGLSDMASFLIENRANISGSKRTGPVNSMSPLAHSLKAGHFELAKLLLKNGASTEQEGGPIPTFSFALHYHPNISANRSCNEYQSIIKFMLEHQPTEIHKTVSYWEKSGTIKTPVGTLLHMMSKEGCLAEMKILLAHWADVNSRKENGMTPLHNVKDIETAQLLLDSGADINARDYQGETPIFQFIKSPESKAIAAREFFARNGANINVQDNKGYSLLHHSGLHNDIEKVKHLLKIGVDKDLRNSAGETAREVLIKSWNDKKTKTEAMFLLRNYPRTASSEKELELIRASLFGDVNLVKKLLKEGVYTEIEDCHHWRPLHIAAWHGNTEVARALIGHGADIEAEIAIPNEGDIIGKLGQYGLSKLPYLVTPLQIAARRGHSHIATFLIKNQANVNGSGRAEKGHVNSMSPLAHAFNAGHYDIVKLLQNSGASSDQEGGPMPTVSFVFLEFDHQSAITKSCDACLNIIKKMHELSLSAINFRISSWERFIDPLGNGTPIHLMAKAGCAQVIRSLFPGSNANDRNYAGKTPLHHVKDAATARELLMAGADIHAKDNLGRTPIFQDDQLCNPDIVDIRKLLVQKGADINARDKNGNTLLHALSSCTCNTFLLSRTLKAGANHNVRNNEGKTAHDLIFEQWPDHAKNSLAELVQRFEYHARRCGHKCRRALELNGMSMLDWWNPDVRFECGK